MIHLKTTQCVKGWYKNACLSGLPRHENSSSYGCQSCPVDNHGHPLRLLAISTRQSVPRLAALVIFTHNSNSMVVLFSPKIQNMITNFAHEIHIQNTFGWIRNNVFNTSCGTEKNTKLNVTVRIDILSVLYRFYVYIYVHIYIDTHLFACVSVGAHVPTLTMSQWSSSGNPVAIQCVWNLDPSVHWNANWTKKCWKPVCFQCASSGLSVAF